MTTVDAVYNRLDQMPARFAAAIREQQQIERAREQERYRGVKDMTYRVPPFPAATSLIIGAQDGPDQGFTWNLKLITGKLSANDSVAAYLGEDATGTLIGYAPPPGAAPAQLVFVITWTSDQKLRHAGESIFLTTSGTGLLSQVALMAVQVPAEEIGKVLY